jgi:hypothetical protein
MTNRVLTRFSDVRRRADGTHDEPIYIVCTDKLLNESE